MVVRLVTLAAWAVLGFLFWIPLLARVTVAFSGAVLYSALTGADTRALSYALECAVRFYGTGFRIIDETLETEGSAGAPVPLLHPDVDLQWNEKAARFALEALWTVIFWIVAVAPFAY